MWTIPDGNFGLALYRDRLAKNLTQAQLARRVGVSQPLISSWERNRYRPDPGQVFKLERVLGRKPGDLSRHLGYFPDDEKTLLGRDLVDLFGAGEALRLLKRLAQLQDPGDAGLELAG